MIASFVPTACALGLCLVLAGATGDGGVDDSGSLVQRGAQVGGSRRAVTPPLRDIVPVPEKPGYVVHEVKPVPRPHRDAAGDEPVRDH